MADVKGYNMPDYLYYHKDHAWARVDGTKVTVGMNDFFQKEAGDIVFIDLPDTEEEVGQGEVCGKIQSRKWIGKLVAPVSGGKAAMRDLGDNHHALDAVTKGVKPGGGPEIDFPLAIVLVGKGEG